MKIYILTPQKGRKRISFFKFFAHRRARKLAREKFQHVHIKEKLVIK